MKLYKKLFSSLFALLSAIALCLSFSAGNAAFAESENDVYEIEYSSEIVIPILRLEPNQSYKVQVFDKADTEFKTPLKVEGFEFFPERMGEYVIRYLINDNGREYYSYARLVLSDNSTPVFEVVLKESYNVGDTVDLTPKITDNTAHLAEVSYSVLYNDDMLTGAVNGGKLKLDKAGEYKVRVSVKDAGGNTAAKTYSFTVVGENNGDVLLIVFCSVGGALVLAAAAVTTFLLVKKKRAKTAETLEAEKEAEDENE